MMSTDGYKYITIHEKIYLSTLVLDAYITSYEARVRQRTQSGVTEQERRNVGRAGGQKNVEGNTNS